MIYPPVPETMVVRRRFIKWYGFLNGSVGGTGGKGEVGVNGTTGAMADKGVSEKLIARSVCTVRDCKFWETLEIRCEGMGMRAPFAVLGSGGLSSVGEFRPFPIEGRRPGGWDEDRFRVVTRDVLDPGNEATDLGKGTDPIEVVDSAGDDERGVYGSDILALRPKMAPSLGVGFIIWLDASERIETVEAPLGRDAWGSRGDGGATFEEGGCKGGEGMGMAGSGGESCICADDLASRIVD